MSSSHSDKEFIADAVICARNAAATLAGVLARLPSRQLRSVVVVDRGSADSTAQVARDAGAVVLRQAVGGYGAACKRAVEHLEALPRPPDAVVFVAADGSDPEAEIKRLLTPIEVDNAEFVIGVRASQRKRKGDRIALGLIGVIYRHRFTAMSSFRALRFPALVALAIEDRSSGWDAEMQVRAVRLGLRIVEVEVGPGQGTGAASDVRGHLARTGRVLFRILRHSTAR